MLKYKLQTAASEIIDTVVVTLKVVMVLVLPIALLVLLIKMM